MRAGANSIAQARIKQLAEGRAADPQKGIEAIEPKTAEEISHALQIKLEVVQSFMPKPPEEPKPKPRAKPSG